MIGVSALSWWFARSNDVPSRGTVRWLGLMLRPDVFGAGLTIGPFASRASEVIVLRISGGRIKNWNVVVESASAGVGQGCVGTVSFELEMIWYSVVVDIFLVGY